jgi:HSP20 family molecular chaperone IbpA
MSSQFPFHGIFSSLGQEQSLPTTAETDPFADAELPAPSFADPKPVAKSPGHVAVDIFEQDNYYIIVAPIAGVRLSDLDIEVTDNVITIRGARQQGATVPNDQYYLQECFWGEFSRSVTLPFTIDPKKIKATFNKECILKILIPKEEKVKIVRINEV